MHQNYTIDFSRDNTNEYLAAIEALGGDEAGRRCLRRDIENGFAYWGGKPQAVSYLPKCCPVSARNDMIRSSKILYGILEKIVHHYQTDPEYRKEFHFDERIQDLLLLPSLFETVIPFMRVDFLYDEKRGNFYYCEFNTDACGGMIETLELTEALTKSPPFAAFSASHKTFSDAEMPVDGWVCKVKSIYCENADAPLPARPQVAIVACIDSAYPEKTTLNGFISPFEKAGMSCSVFDVRDIDFDGKNMIGRRALAGKSNVKIDVIWRYTIMVDLLEHWDDVQPFLNGLKNAAVPMIGPLSTQIVHDKQVLAVMQRPATRAFMTEEENQFISDHVPKTMFLKDVENIDAVVSYPEKWVLKPADWYASINVTVGASCEKKVWKSQIESCLHDEMPWIIQEYIEPSQSPVIPLYGHENDFTGSVKNYNDIFGVYILKGEYSGIYLRQGPHRVIGDRREGVTGSVLWVET